MESHLQVCVTWQHKAERPPLANTRLTLLLSYYGVTSQATCFRTKRVQISSLRSSRGCFIRVCSVAGCKAYITHRSVCSYSCMYFHTSQHTQGRSSASGVWLRLEKSGTKDEPAAVNNSTKLSLRTEIQFRCRKSGRPTDPRGDQLQHAEPRWTGGRESLRLAAKGEGESYCCHHSPRYGVPGGIRLLRSIEPVKNIRRSYPEVW